MTPLKITKRFLGKTWDQCNCLELVRMVYGDLGHRLPENYKGIKTSDIPALLNENRKYAQAMLVGACNHIGGRVRVDEIKRYDLVLLWQRENKTLFPGVYLSDGKVMTSSIESGVCIAKISRVNRLVAAWRIL